MKQEDQNKLTENQDAIFQGIKKLFYEQGLDHVEIRSLEIEMPEDATDDAKFLFAEIECPVGYKKIIKIHPITKEQKVVCVPK